MPCSCPDWPNSTKVRPLVPYFMQESGHGNLLHNVFPCALMGQQNFWGQGPNPLWMRGELCSISKHWLWWWLNLMLVPSTSTVTLPFYFVVIAAFLLGIVCCFLLLMWDRVRMSARAVRAQWRVRSMQSEQLQMISQLRQLAHSPVEERPALLEKFRSGYEARKKAFEEERKKKKELDIKQLTIDATASPTPTTNA